MNLAKKDDDHCWTKSKPDSEPNETANNHIKIPIEKNMMTPVTRCRIEAIAEAGKLMVFSSRLIGLCLFTNFTHSKLITLLKLLNVLDRIVTNFTTNKI